MSAALLAAGLPAPRFVRAPCERPREVGANGSHTTQVACGSAATRHARALRGPARLLFALPIDPNRADALTLESLPGIGPLRAAAILAARARRPFARVEELTRVRGIGPRTLARIEDVLAIAPSQRRAWPADDSDGLPGRDPPD